MCAGEPGHLSSNWLRPSLLCGPRQVTLSGLQFSCPSDKTCDALQGPFPNQQQGSQEGLVEAGDQPFWRGGCQPLTPRGPEAEGAGALGLGMVLLQGPAVEESTVVRW